MPHNNLRSASSAIIKPLIGLNVSNHGTNVQLIQLTDHRNGASGASSIFAPSQMLM